MQILLQFYRLDFLHANDDAIENYSPKMAIR